MPTSELKPAVEIPNTLEVKIWRGLGVSDDTIRQWLERSSAQKAELEAKRAGGFWPFELETSNRMPDLTPEKGKEEPSTLEKVVGPGGVLGQGGLLDAAAMALAPFAGVNPLSGKKIEPEREAPASRGRPKSSRPSDTELAKVGRQARRAGKSQAEAIEAAKQQKAEETAAAPKPYEPPAVKDLSLKQGLRKLISEGNKAAAKGDTETVRGLLPLESDVRQEINKQKGKAYQEKLGNAGKPMGDRQYKWLTNTFKSGERVWDEFPERQHDPNYEPPTYLAQPEGGEAAPAPRLKRSKAPEENPYVVQRTGRSGSKPFKGEPPSFHKTTEGYDEPSSGPLASDLPKQIRKIRAEGASELPNPIEQIRANGDARLQTLVDQLNHEELLQSDLQKANTHADRVRIAKELVTIREEITSELTRLKEAGVELTEPSSKGEIQPPGKKSPSAPVEEALPETKSPITPKMFKEWQKKRAATPKVKFPLEPPAEPLGDLEAGRPAATSPGKPHKTDLLSTSAWDATSGAKPRPYMEPTRPMEERKVPVGPRENLRIKETPKKKSLPPFQRLMYLNSIKKQGLSEEDAIAILEAVRPEINWRKK